MWSEEETDFLLLGAHRFGVGDWTKIHTCSDYRFNDRTALDLKDRFRVIMPEEYRGPNMGDPSLPTGAAPQGYMMMGNVLRIVPKPATSVGSLTMWYAPVYTALSADTDALPYVVEPGYEEFIVNQAVIAAKIKEDTDTSALERRQAQISAQIQQSLINRDMGRRQHVVDVAGPYAYGY